MQTNQPTQAQVTATIDADCAKLSALMHSDKYTNDQKSQMLQNALATAAKIEATGRPFAKDAAAQMRAHVDTIRAWF